MQHDPDRPSTEPAATPRPPVGENVKALVTPGDDAADEAEAESGPDGGAPGAGNADDKDAQASPDPGEAPEEEQSPT